MKTGGKSGMMVHRELGMFGRRSPPAVAKEFTKLG